jgi:hypothetical protein
MCTLFSYLCSFLYFLSQQTAFSCLVRWFVRYGLPQSRAWAIAHNLEAAMRRRRFPSADPFETRAVQAARAEVAAAAQRAGAHSGGPRPNGADERTGFGGYDTLSSDEELGESPWRAAADGFGVGPHGGAAAPLGSVFGHGGGFGALGGGGEAAAARKAVSADILGCLHSPSPSLVRARLLNRALFPNCLVNFNVFL